MSDTTSFTELVPTTGRVVDLLRDITDEPRSALADRPWVYSNMVTSLDGAISIDGLSEALGGPADQALFGALRSVADVILVGATTAIEENYRPASDRHAAARVARGQQPRPTIAILTRSLSIEPGHRVFADPSARPLIITTSTAPADRRDALSEVADLVTAGDDDIDLAVALAELADRGHQRALLEGGPTVNGQFIAADLIDEWNISVSPRLTGGDSVRAAHGPDPGASRSMTLTRLWLADGMLFGRWVRAEHHD
ncbi:MAG: pyrimidine reductase family protein [Acidimicrobiales bacterium]